MEAELEGHGSVEDGGIDGGDGRDTRRKRHVSQTTDSEPKFSAVETQPWSWPRLFVRIINMTLRSQLSCDQTVDVSNFKPQALLHAS